MKVLVLGAGQVATAVAAARPAVHKLVTCARAQLDITDAAAVERVLEAEKPDWVVNAAAYTAVDLAEDARAQAVLVNDTAVAGLTHAAQRAGIRLLHLSTDFVFDGASGTAYRPHDAANPLNAYGASKLGGERHVLNGGGSGIVLRTSWVYAASGRNFVLTMLRLMRDKERLSVVCDQIGSPTWASGLAAAIWALMEADAPGGVHHWTDLGVASWYDFAVAIHDEALPRGLLSRGIAITPIPSSAYATRARRPAFSALDSSATRALIEVPARHWRHQLGAMLDELRAS